MDEDEDEDEEGDEEGDEEEDAEEGEGCTCPKSWTVAKAGRSSLHARGMRVSGAVGRVWSFKNDTRAFAAEPAYTRRGGEVAAVAAVVAAVAAVVTFAAVVVFVNVVVVVVEGMARWR